MTHRSRLPVRVQHAAKHLLPEEEGVPQERVHGSFLILALQSEEPLTIVDI